MAGERKELVDPLVIAFVQGAKFWEFSMFGATMWQSDQRNCEQEAMKRLENGTLGKHRDDYPGQ